MSSDIPVKLRAVERSDLAFTRACRNDPLIHVPALGRRFPITSAGEEAWFDSLGRGSPPEEVTMIVAAVDDGRPLGMVMLRAIDWVNRNAMFGLWVSPDAHGRGIGSASCEQMLAIGFDQLDLHKIALDVLTSNERALSIYRRVGFTEEGRLREQVFVDGEYVDVLRMALTKATWAARTTR
jgi:RimJ/RimL family protein N-acetyltransferase